ncbi:MAG: helix-turn-helix domain-containing protein [Methylococcaceae bacterium]|nr:helix-turn-helix domain-containing protein [Methylococcaceae bacterium]
MNPTTKSYTQLQPEERVTLASLHQQAYSVRSMAETLKRSPSTISRELRRNSQDGHYGSGVAHAAVRRVVARLVLSVNCIPAR